MFNPPPETLPFMRQCGNILWSRTRHRRQYDMAHALCILCNYRYKHTLRICNPYCFPTAKMVMRTLLNVTLYLHCLSYVCIMYKHIHTHSSYGPVYLIHICAVAVYGETLSVDR